MKEMTDQDTTPLFAQPIVGFRFWKVTNEDLLGGISYPNPWPTNRPMVSSCQHHVAPVNGCGCGLYAYHTLEDMLSYHEIQTHRGAVICGIVVARGQTEVHYHGFRAEEAQIVALAPAGNNLLSEEAQTRLVQRMAKKYGVPAVAQSDLPKLAAQYAPPNMILPPKPVVQIPPDLATSKVFRGAPRQLIRTFGFAAGIFLLLAIVLATLQFSGSNLTDRLENIPGDNPVNQLLISPANSLLTPDGKHLAPASEWQQRSPKNLRTWRAAIQRYLQETNLRVLIKPQWQLQGTHAQQVTALYQTIQEIRKKDRLVSNIIMFFLALMIMSGICFLVLLDEMGPPR